ncbi:hypothetical protein ABID21_001901 [Pseudorhizobium tarimense]|uniref:Uncharacterized protein n=1 Tax=Pseudorhizobium tarimense TaxID=1079109 RepID=A0ABV2H5G3_9HYPH|nr:hypothetical protein [Pseudorhizobium tarimense]MCJ8518995.1 hypothetical protein [Pseudorhizobium tarimense]
MTDTRRHRCDIYKVARQCGVRLFDGHLHSPTSRKPFECFCKPTVREIGRDHGEDHLRLVFMLMTGTKGNALELYSDMIKAVSAILIENPELVKSPSLISDFNAIDLGSVRRKAKGMRSPFPRWMCLYTLILIKFYRPIQGDLLDMIGEAA